MWCVPTVKYARHCLKQWSTLNASSSLWPGGIWTKLESNHWFFYGHSTNNLSIFSQTFLLAIPFLWPRRSLNANCLPRHPVRVSARRRISRLSASRTSGRREKKNRNNSSCRWCVAKKSRRNDICQCVPWVGRWRMPVLVTAPLWLPPLCPTLINQNVVLFTASSGNQGYQLNIQITSSPCICH